VINVLVYGFASRSKTKQAKNTLRRCSRWPRLERRVRAMGYVGCGDSGRAATRAVVCDDPALWRRDRLE
jgi:hypothetical protein